MTIAILAIVFTVMGAMAAVPAFDTVPERECRGTPEFTHQELTERNGTCYVCGGYGLEVTS